MKGYETNNPQKNEYELNKNATRVKSKKKNEKNGFDTIFDHVYVIGV